MMGALEREKEAQALLDEAIMQAEGAEAEAVARLLRQDTSGLWHAAARDLLGSELARRKVIKEGWTPEQAKARMAALIVEAASEALILEVRAASSVSRPRPGRRRGRVRR